MLRAINANTYYCCTRYPSAASLPRAEGGGRISQRGEYNPQFKTGHTLLATEPDVGMYGDLRVCMREATAAAEGHVHVWNTLIHRECRCRY